MLDSRSLANNSFKNIKIIFDNILNNNVKKIEIMFLVTDEYFTSNIFPKENEVVASFISSKTVVLPSI